MGAPKWPPSPGTFVAPRRSRAAPLGPRTFVAPRRSRAAPLGPRMFVAARRSRAAPLGPSWQQHDLAVRAGLQHGLVGGGRLREGELLADDGAQRAVGEA